jgi:hypothetical protein
VRSKRTHRHRRAVLAFPPTTDKGQPRFQASLSNREVIALMAAPQNAMRLIKSS